MTDADLITRFIDKWGPGGAAHGLNEILRRLLALNRARAALTPAPAP